LQHDDLLQAHLRPAIGCARERRASKRPSLFLRTASEARGDATQGRCPLRRARDGGPARRPRQRGPRPLHLRGRDDRLEKLEDAFRRSKQRIELESEALDERYEIFAGSEQDQVWLRRLFSPTFIVWLGEEAPKKFGFELVDGTLCCYVSGHKKKAAELDTIRAASAAVAKRLREESQE